MVVVKEGEGNGYFNFVLVFPIQIKNKFILPKVFKLHII